MGTPHGLKAEKAAALGFKDGQRVRRSVIGVRHDIPTIGQTDVGYQHIEGRVSEKDGRFFVKPDKGRTESLGADWHIID